MLVVLFNIISSRITSGKQVIQKTNRPVPDNSQFGR